MSKRRVVRVTCQIAGAQFVFIGTPKMVSRKTYRATHILGWYSRRRYMKKDLIGLIPITIGRYDVLHVEKGESDMLKDCPGYFKEFGLLAKSIEELSPEQERIYHVFGRL